MSDIKIKDKINNFVKKKNPLTKYDYKTNLFQKGLLDSFGLVQLVVYCENEFHIDISNMDFFSKFNNINKISKFIYLEINKKKL